MKNKDNAILKGIIALFSTLLIIGGVSTILKNDRKGSLSSSKNDIVTSSNIKSETSKNTTSTEQISSNSVVSSSSSNVEVIKQLSIVDGSIDTSLKTSYIDETTNFSYEIKGITSLSSVSSSYQFCEKNGKTYTRAINTGGSCNAKSKYIKLTVPQNVKIKVSIVSSSTSAQTIFITPNCESTYNEVNWLEQKIDNNSWAVSEFSEELNSTYSNYYINFTGNVKIAEINVLFIK